MGAAWTGWRSGRRSGRCSDGRRTGTEGEGRGYDGCASRGCGKGVLLMDWNGRSWAAMGDANIRLGTNASKR